MPPPSYDEIRAKKKRAVCHISKGFIATLPQAGRLNDDVTHSDSLSTDVSHTQGLRIKKEDQLT
jgi:hypothetical protein